MTAEIFGKLRVQCVFIPDWECPIETPEIPLEVCKLCLEARKIQSKPIKITRQVKSVEVMPAHRVLSDTDTEVPQIVS